MTAPATSAAADRILVLARTLRAPRALVWRAWTDRAHAMAWWGPKDFVALECELPLQVGAPWHARMRGPDGTVHGMRGVVREVVATERLAFTFAWDDSPEERTLVTVTFADHAAGTLMTFTQGAFPSVESRDSHASGWTECFDRLQAHVEAPR